jgi:hypothetical protein
VLAAAVSCALAGSSCSSGGGGGVVKLGAPERFDWISQPIEFQPPPQKWYRDGDNSGGLLGVRFILSGGGGQVMSVAAYRRWHEKLPRKEILELLDDLDSLDRRSTLRALGRLRVQVTDPLTDGEVWAAEAVNAAVTRATDDLLQERTSFVRGDIQAALAAVDDYQPTLEQLLPRMRLQPEQLDEAGLVRWKLGFGVDTTIAGLPAHVSHDTLITPEQEKLVYQQVFWVVDGCAFQAVFQGRPENQHIFAQLVESVRFPERGTNATN